MSSKPPVEFTDEIKRLFTEKKLQQARQRLLDTLHHGWDGHCNLIAFTYLYADNRTEADAQEAMNWLERGVDCSEVDSKVILGRILVSGELGKVDFPRGIALLEQAADANVLMAVLTLAQIHQQGVEGFAEPDPLRALDHLRKAADLGDPNAAYHLALQLEQAPAQDFQQAFRYFDKAAQGGLSQAMHNVGVYYLHGKGIPKNINLALAYLTEASKLGSPLSMLSLALLYLDGVDVARDRGVSLSWLLIYQMLFPDTDIPEQLQLLQEEASEQEIRQASESARNFIHHQLNKSPTGTVH